MREKLIEAWLERRESVWFLRYQRFKNKMTETKIDWKLDRSVLVSTKMALLFGENPHAVAYSAQPLCSSG
jgi:hypothetical protein